jgi:hypothetical protein
MCVCTLEKELSEASESSHEWRHTGHSSICATTVEALQKFHPDGKEKAKENPEPRVLGVP